MFYFIIYYYNENGLQNTNGLEDAIREYATKYILRASFQDINVKQFLRRAGGTHRRADNAKMNSTEVEKIVNLGDYAVKKAPKAKVRYATKKALNSAMNSETKLSYCRGIARYYVKVLNLFSAVVMTLNPQFKFKDSDGTTRTVKLKDRNAVRDGRQIDVSFANDSFCKRRFEALMKLEKGNDDNVEIVNSVCDMTKITCVSHKRQVYRI